MKIPAIFVTVLGEKIKGHVIGRELIPWSNEHFELVFKVSSRNARYYDCGQIIRTCESFTYPRDSIKVVNKVGHYIVNQKVDWQSICSGKDKDK